jgi:adenylate cyclase
VHNKLSLGFDYLGPQEMKNVAPVNSYRVTTGSEVAGARSYTVGGGSSRPRQEPLTRLQAAADWFASLPRTVASLLTIAAFLVVINLFTNPHRIWFHWPVAALLFIVILRTALRRRPRSDRSEERRGMRWERRAERRRNRE